MGIVDDRTLAGPSQRWVVGELRHTGITADQIREPTGSDVIMIPAALVIMTVANVERLFTSQILGEHSVGLIRTIKREAVEGESDEGRVRLGVVGKRCFHTTGILVIMIHPRLLWMPAA